MTLILIKLFALLLIALISGLIDTIAGGGGLIVVPALMLFGLTPLQVLATNKLQANFGSGTAAWRFMRLGKISFKEIAWAVGWSFIGAVVGTKVIVWLHPDLLEKLIPLLLLGVWLYLFFKPTLGQQDGKARWSQGLFFMVFGFSLGFYDGFLGPGTGSFWVVAIIGLLGWNIKKATMHTKIYNFTSNFASLIFFIAAGHVLYTIGLVMGVGQVIGARIGTHLVMSKGAQLIRPMLLTMTGIMMVVLIYQQWF